jgi:hypothetical protein
MGIAIFRVMCFAASTKIFTGIVPMKFTFDRWGLAAAALLSLFAFSLNAAEVPQNLGYGLDTLVASNIALKNPAQGQQLYNGYATEAAAYYASQAITDEATGRVMVDITLSGRVPLDTVKNAAQAKVGSLTITATNLDYRGAGILEGYVSIDDAAALSQLKGVRGVFLALKPDLNSSATPGAAATGPAPDVLPGDHLRKLGTAFDQGVVQHRVDRINQFYNPTAPVNYDGTGISIGLMSDSFDTRTAAPHAATAVTNFDLPGSATNPVNTLPVVVLEDEPAPGTDEGRAMTEIAYKMAPRARLGFATGFLGEVQFGNDIRALAALPGFTYPVAVQQGFKADVIADDISYGGEPFYGESIIGNAIDDVTAAGVSYFSSAGNNIGINAYESSLRIVPNGTGLTAAAGNTALAGTNINLAGVPANLYAGGFHNFNPASGQLDVAQLVNMPTAAQSTEMQWDDPYDQRDLVLNQPPIFSSGGNISGAVTTVTFDQNSVPSLPQFNKGTPYVIQETATSGNFDGIVSIFDSSNNLIVSQDTGTDETVNFYPPATDQYHIVITAFGGTTGNFTLVINTAAGSAGVTTDLNLLVFRADTGAYISTRSLTTNNLANNRPVELGSVASPAGQTQIQFLISRANNPVAPQLPTRVRWSVRGNGAAGIGPAEYFTYNAVTTKGHATARGCNGTAAYSVFRPNIPESFTSPGPATILFDKDANRLTTPDVRQQPRVAAADAANNSFFSGDSTSDLDANPNFSGTSAAAPHAAALAALVLQARGGPGSVAPAQMTSLLQNNAFPHDLDPSSASATALTTDGGAVVLTIDSDNDSNTSTGQNDPSSLKLSYLGPGSLASITFNPAGTAGTAGHVTGGNNGVQDDVASSPATIAYFENNFPGLIFLPTSKAFTLGTLSGLTAADIVAPQSVAPFAGFSNLAPAPANGTSMFWTMSVGFPNSNFTDGKIVRFTVGRGAAHSATTGNGTVIGPGTVTLNPIADLFGGGVFLPSGTVVTDGMAFSGTTTGGGTFSGTIKNAIGAGYSPVDGYGFINAEAAVAPQPTSPTGVGAASPSNVAMTGNTLLTVKVTKGATPTSTNLVVRGNLSSVGGLANQAFYDDGSNGDVTANDGVFSYSATVPQGVISGAKNLAVTITDAQSRSGSASIALNVLTPSAPTGSGNASPSSAVASATALLTVTVSGGTNPASSGIVVTADLSSIGGSATQAFYNDGTHGDVTSGDSIWSYNATVAVGTTAGAKTFPVTITDAQARSGSASIAFTVVTPTSPSGSGTAAPSTVYATQSTLLTVATTAGTNPTSTGITVTADLSSIGGSATQAFTDNGGGSFSYSATVPLGTAPGGKSLPVTIADAQARSGSTNISLSVLASTSPSGSGNASPNSGIVGATPLLTVVVSGGTNPASTGITVTADLSGIGGSATQTFYDDGSNGDVTLNDGTYSFSATVGAGATSGLHLIPVAIADVQGRSSSTTIAFNVVTPGSPTGTGLSTPTTVQLGGTAALIVAVTPGSSPTSTGLAVTVDLSSIGGSATQTFYDDGTNGDQVAGDNIFSFSAIVPITTTLGPKSLPATITDAQLRTGGATIQLIVADEIFQDGFE